MKKWYALTSMALVAFGFSLMQCSTAPAETKKERVNAKIIENKASSEEYLKVVKIAIGIKIRRQD